MPSEQDVASSGLDKEEAQEMKKAIGAAMAALAIGGCVPQPQPPFMPSVFAKFDLTPQPGVQFDANGIPSVRIWSTGEFNQSPTTVSQWGLGAFARGDMEKAKKAADWLLSRQAANGGFPLTFDHSHPDPRGFHMKAPWYSSITQGNAISLIIRMYGVTRNPAYRDSALRALKLLQMPVSDGGLQGALKGMVWFEETPDPKYQNHIFNGSVFALLGIHDLYLATGSVDALQLWVQGEASLRANINAHVAWAPHQGKSLPDPWMVYDLQVNGFPESPNYLTGFYAGIHIKLYREMSARTGLAVYSEMADAMDRSLTEYLKAHPQPTGTEITAS